MPFVNFREGKIFYTDQGRGRAIILLHGFLGSSLIFHKILPVLSQQFRVITIDLPGHGRSDSFGYVHRMETMSEAVYAVLKYLHLRRIVLAGHSMGGYVCLSFAERFPEMVKGLIMIHSTVFPDSEKKQLERDKAIRVVKSNKEKYLAEAVQKLLYRGNKQYHEHLKEVYRIAATTSVQGIVAALEGMKMRKNMEILLHFITYPILFIQGEHDKILPPSNTESQWNIAHQTHVLRLGESGHMGIIEEPELVIEEIRKFCTVSFRNIS